MTKPARWGKPVAMAADHDAEERTDDARPLAIVDIDGVVADVRHRLRHVQRRPKDWEAFFEEATLDPPHDEGVTLVRRLADDHEIVYLTGRPERLRDDTEEWLGRHGIGGHLLVMRPSNDRRPAAQVKVELLEVLSRGRRVGVVVDDDPVVIAAMDSAGHPTRHADWEQRSVEADASLLRAQEVEGRT